MVLNLVPFDMPFIRLILPLILQEETERDEDGERSLTGWNASRLALSKPLLRRGGGAGGTSLKKKKNVFD